MSVNEHKEFEAINRKADERKVQVEVECHSTEEFYRSKKVKAVKKTILRISAVAMVFAAAFFGIEYLEKIGWINDIFCAVLMCLAGSVATFKVGYFWHEIKQ